MSLQGKKNTAKKTVLTCAQPTGKLHLGNYVGAVKQWISYLPDYTCFFGIVDQHAITIPYSPAALRNNTLDCVAQYIACGLDPKKCHIFVQSQIPFHTELAWILACLCPLGLLERMTQFKDKSKKFSVNAGLLYYPILQSADILLYNADIVPVGEDQKQHIELARDLAQKFNQTYSPTFPLPEPHIPKSGGRRVMSLQNPTTKMSKSDPNPKGTLFLWDEPATIQKKIGSAITDSGSQIKFSEEKPGIANLLTLASELTQTPIAQIEEAFAQKNYGAFKTYVTEVLVEALRPIQENYRSLKENPDYLKSVLEEGCQAAYAVAQKTLSKVYRKVGFLA